jgi:hypothetical protein
MAINYRDPRFQEALLSAGSRPTANVPGVAAGITSAFAGQQQGVLTRFSELATNKRRFDSNLRLAQKRLAFEKTMSKQSLKDARDASNLGIISGLGTSIIAGLIGRDRRIKTAEAAKEQAAFNRTVTQSQQKHQETLEGILKRMRGTT